MLGRSGENGAENAYLPPLDIDETASFRHPATREAAAHWAALLNGRAMPSRADLDPRALTKILPYMALIELRQKADGSPDYFIRLAGTASEQVFGSVTGKLISEFLPPEVEARWQLALGTAVRTLRPIRTIGRIAFQRKTWLEAETFVAPLGNDGHTVSMLLIVLATWEAGNGPAH